MARNTKDKDLPFTMEEEETKAVAVGTVGSGTLAPRSEYDEDAGAGFENMDQSELMIPVLAILQKGSPQVDEAAGEYIPAAKPGMFFNTVTKELYDGKTGVRFIPVHRTHSFVEWIPRTRGGGFVRTHDPESPLVAKARNGKNFGKFGTPALREDGTESGEMNDLVETFGVFGLLIREDGTYEPVVLNFSSTQIRKYREWMHKARSIQIRTENGIITPPLFAHVYRLTTQAESKDQYTWYGYRINFDGENAEAARLPKASDLYVESKTLRGMAASGQVQQTKPIVPEVASEGDPSLDGQTF